MKRSRTFIFILVAAAMIAVNLAACGSSGTADTQASALTEAQTGEDVQTSKKLSIVCTIFPEYDFVKQILGDNPADMEVTYLLGSGVDLHNYQASVDDMIKITTSDLFLYVGGMSDEWVDAVILQAGEQFRSLSLSEMTEVKAEVIVEGMQDEDDHDHDHEEEHEEETERDEHVWLSLKSSCEMIQAISNELCALDRANADYYKANEEAYRAKLMELDSRYESMVSESARKTILVADRFPFRYLADDYGLTYYAAFPGCSAETEASFETVVFLAQKVGELKLPAVCVIDGSDGRIAKTVIENSPREDVVIRTLNSIQSVSKDDIDKGISYLNIMEENLIQLKEALN